MVVKGRFAAGGIKCYLSEFTDIIIEQTTDQTYVDGGKLCSTPVFELIQTSAYVDEVGRYVSAIPIRFAGEGAAPVWVPRTSLGVAADFVIDVGNSRAWVDGEAIDLDDIMTDGVISLSDLGSITPATAGTILSTAICPATNNANQAIWGLDDGGSDNDRLVSWIASTNYNSRMVVVSASSVSVDDTGFTLGASQSFKRCDSWEAENLAWSVNGATPRTDASVTIPAGLDRFTAWRDHNAAPWLGTKGVLSYWNSRLSNTEVQNLCRI